MSDIILPLEEFSSSGWTDYGANYFLDRISTLADGSVSQTGFRCGFFYRNTGSNQLFTASDETTISLLQSFDGVRSASSSFSLNFLASLNFDELYFVVFYDDPILLIEAPVFIKQVANVAYSSGSQITINNFQVSFLGADPTAPFEFQEIDPFALANISVNYTGNGSFDAGLPIQTMKVNYTGNGSISFNAKTLIANGTFTGNGSFSLIIQGAGSEFDRTTETSETRTIETGTIRVIES